MDDSFSVDNRIEHEDGVGAMNSLPYMNSLLRVRPLRVLLSLFLIAAPPAWAQQAPTGPGKWEKEISAFEKLDATNPPKKGSILFIGSSSIRLWQSLAQDFPNYDVINRGFGGSQIVDSTHFVDRIVFPYSPRMIVMYAGGNDINAGKSAERVAADFRAFTEKVRAQLPEVEIAFISIAGNPARWAQVEKVKEANRLIAEFCKATPRMKFIDVFSPMLGSDGLPKPEIFRDDRLHMNAEGYKIWTSVIAPYLGTPDRAP